MITGFTNVDAVEAMDQAPTTIYETHRPRGLLLIIERSSDNKRLIVKAGCPRRAVGKVRFESMVGHHPKMMQVLNLVKRIASQVTVT